MRGQILYQRYKELNARLESTEVDAWDEMSEGEQRVWNALGSPDLSQAIENLLCAIDSAGRSELAEAARQMDTVFGHPATKISMRQTYWTMAKLLRQRQLRRWGREPTHAEQCEEVRRILKEGTCELAQQGKLRHQRKG